MTDAQNFYLLLAAFYLFECLSFAPRGAQAFLRKDQQSWRWHPPTFHLSGTHKDVFCAPIIPWPGMIAVFPPSEGASQDLSPFALRHLRQRSRTLDRMTRSLRRSSLVVFLHYFFILPYFYYFHLGTAWVFAAILTGELLAVITAIQFYRIHRRLFPDLKGERRLETFFNAFFPWHAMRSADLIVKRVTANWNPLLCLISQTRSPANTKELTRLWRRASQQGNTDELSALLSQAEIDPTSWSQPPLLERNQQYCPICHTIYEDGPETCADCTEIPLISSKS